MMCGCFSFLAWAPQPAFTEIGWISSRIEVSEERKRERGHHGEFIACNLAAEPSCLESFSSGLMRK